ncbi:FAD-dependent oxidoreductase [Sphingobium cupriresistens]|uniref:Oxidoreductase n=1 Tax=Sphingobium cupriresistens LL01 TaxID=1420583 RepID=A0A0J7XJB3_9SPHN|nr:GMC family oxidoreductase [Sphingobium cupriresistens]KMS51218.1 oxidoreductase [Sphingobium cupriresistens LL01]
MMLDLDDIDGAIRRQTEICVVGAGAAGIALTRRLLAAGHEVLLLESGGKDFEAATADLNAGANIGEDYYPLHDARMRFFGGTTAIWGGRCAELDPIDLERRDWVPHSGWPIGWSDLAPYYAEARPMFGLPDRRYNIADLRSHGVPVPHFSDQMLNTPIWTFDPRFNRFTFDACDDIISHPRCQVICHASVTGIERRAGAVQRLEARSLKGGRLIVSADVVVLAAGGIENARLLLTSDIGNQYDQVGRYFMEHPHARGGRIVGGDSWNLLKSFARRHRIDGQDVAALITPAAEVQRREGLLNSSLTIVARQPARATQFVGMRVYGSLKHDLEPTRRGRALWMATKKAANWAQRHIDPARPWLLHKAGLADIALLVRAEQAPNPDSRITLGGEVDALGVRRVKLDWRLSALDKRSMGGLVGALGEELTRLGSGRVEPAAWLAGDGPRWQSDPLISSHPIGGYHHIGTTRMSTSPRTGVVDADGRVHGLHNLYVVGSSTFSTAGWANPTLTIAALALRTADRISAALVRLRRASDIHAAYAWNDDVLLGRKAS